MTTETIPENLRATQCGGWDTNQSVQGKIPVVTGVPGRGGNPLGNIRSGMARRDETLTYPDMGTTRGLGTACRPYVGTPGDLASSRITVMQWSGNGPAEDKIPIEVQHPYYEDPPCLWRTGWQQTDPPHNETKCKEFCEWVNGITREYPKNVEYTFWDCKKAVEIIDPITGNPMDGNALRTATNISARRTGSTFRTPKDSLGIPGTAIWRQSFRH